MNGIGRSPGSFNSGEPLGADQFLEALRAKSEDYWHKHSFHIAMHEGQLTPSDLRKWAANRYYYQKCIPIKDAAIISNCPHREIRRRWMERIVYHDGNGSRSGALEDWLRLAEAVGLTRDEVVDERHVAPGVRFAVDAYVSFARFRPWVESVAASLTEMFAPDLMGDRLAAFERHYTWVDRSGLAYFDERRVQAQDDAEYALEVVVEHCTAREQQERALDALAFKCDVLWTLLNAVEYACQERE